MSEKVGSRVAQEVQEEERERERERGNKQNSSGVEGCHYGEEERCKCNGQSGGAVQKELAITTVAPGGAMSEVVVEGRTLWTSTLSLVSEA